MYIKGQRVASAEIFSTGRGMQLPLQNHKV